MSNSGKDPNDSFKTSSRDDFRQQIEALAAFMKPQKKEKKAVNHWNPLDREIQFREMTSKTKQHLLERQIRHDIIQYIIQSQINPSTDDTP